MFLESIHLQAATLNEEYRILQWNQQDIDVVKGPAQLVAPLITRMAARNRTVVAEGRRRETGGLNEIDTYATNAKHWNEVDAEEKISLRMVQSGVELDERGHGKNR